MDTSKPFKPSKGMVAYGNALVDAILAGAALTDKNIAERAGLTRNTVCNWRSRHPVEFPAWIKETIGAAATPLVLASLAQAATNSKSTGHAAAAKLYLQVVEGWSEKQEHAHTHQGTLEIIPGESEMSHRISAARQAKEEQDARRLAESEDKIIDVKPLGASESTELGDRAASE